MSDVPWESVLGPILFNISDTDSEVKHTLGKFGDDTKLWGAVHASEREDAIHRDLDRALAVGPAEPHEVQQIQVRGLAPGLR